MLPFTKDSKEYIEAYKELRRYVKTFNRAKYANYKDLSDFIEKCPFYNPQRRFGDLECERASTSCFADGHCGHCIEYYEMSEEMYLRKLRKTNPKLYHKELLIHKNHEAWL